MPLRLTRRHALALLGLGAVAGCSERSTTTPAEARGKATMQTIPYGTDPSQYGELHLPSSAARSLRVAVVVHGGYWGSGYGLELGTPLAQDLAAHGVAAWNIEYRRIGNGGGWPGTFVDVADAMDALSSKVNASVDGRLDLAKLVVVGHSAGGHIAAWLAARHKFSKGKVGADPKVTPIGYVAQAGVLDLVRAEREGLGSDAANRLMGGSPQQFPDRYANGSPYELLPLEVPGTLVHGLDDDTVPISQSDSFAAKANQLGDKVTEVRLTGVEHFMLIDPTTPAWGHCRQAALDYLTAS